MTPISIRGARADRGLTQRDVAEALGVSLPTYGLMERDPERITWAQAKRLSEIFGRPIGEFSFRPPAQEESDDAVVAMAEDGARG